MPEPLGDGRLLLACSEHFLTELIEYRGATTYTPERGRIHTLIVIEGRGELDGRPFGEGEVWLVPASAEPFVLKAEAPVRLLRTYVPPAK